MLLKKWRKINSDKLKKYILYALGELILIICGILIAVNINSRLADQKDNNLRCQYLNELKFALEQDRIDVADNLNAHLLWAPRIKAFTESFIQKQLSELDSINSSLQALGSYTTFLQQSKGKVDELKYSKTNLIENTELKNRVLLYQETKIKFLLEHQRRFNRINDLVESYFLEKDITSVNDLSNDTYLYRLALKKYDKHDIMVYHYEVLSKDIVEIKNLINNEINKICSEQID